MRGGKEGHTSPVVTPTEVLPLRQPAKSNSLDTEAEGGASRRRGEQKVRPPRPKPLIL